MTRSVEGISEVALKFRTLTLVQLIALSAALALIGGEMYVRFRAWRGDEDPNVLYLFALGIGTAIGVAADHRRFPRIIVAIAMGTAVVCCVVGNFRIAILERSALSYEFDREALKSDEMFVALETWSAKFNGAPSPPPFTDRMRRVFYSEEEWQEGNRRWQNKTPGEQDAIRIKWTSDFEALHRMGDESVFNVFFASWNWWVYLISAAIAGGVVYVAQQESS